MSNAIADQIWTAATEFFQGQKCPTAGCLGEICTMENTSDDYWESDAYIWRDSFNDFKSIVNLFLNNGAKQCAISMMLEDTQNKTSAGTTFDGARHITIYFEI